eukprot:jgi/Hompol1/4794/HPOL_003886-RA
MFFSHEILTLRKNNSLAIVWLAATLGDRGTQKKLGRKEVTAVNVIDTCNFLACPPEPLALRLSSNMMLGVSRVFLHQTQFLVGEFQTNPVEDRVSRVSHVSRVSCSKADTNNVLLRLKQTDSPQGIVCSIDLAVTQAKPDHITLLNHEMLLPDTAFQESLLRDEGVLVSKSAKYSALKVHRYSLPKHQIQHALESSSVALSPLTARFSAKDGQSSFVVGSVPSIAIIRDDGLDDSDLLLPDFAGVPTDDFNLFEEFSDDVGNPHHQQLHVGNDNFDLGFGDAGLQPGVDEMHTTPIPADFRRETVEPKQLPASKTTKAVISRKRSVQMLDETISLAGPNTAATADQSLKIAWKYQADNPRPSNQAYLNDLLSGSLHMDYIPRDQRAFWRKVVVDHYHSGPLKRSKYTNDSTNTAIGSLEETDLIKQAERPRWRAADYDYDGFDFAGDYGQGSAVNLGSEVGRDAAAPEDMAHHISPKRMPWQMASATGSSASGLYSARSSTQYRPRSSLALDIGTANPASPTNGFAATSDVLLSDQIDNQQILQIASAEKETNQFLAFVRSAIINANADSSADGTISFENLIADGSGAVPSRYVMAQAFFNG